MDIARFRDWLDRYFAAWVSNDPTDVAGLFTRDAVYAIGPFAEEWRGRDEIVRRWTSGQQEDVDARYEILATIGDRGMAHWNVTARGPGQPAWDEWDGILLITFATDGRCRDHREWLVHRVLPAD